MSANDVHLDHPSMRVMEHHNPCNSCCISGDKSRSTSTRCNAQSSSELATLQKCWSTLRLMMRTMYKDGLRDRLSTVTGRTFNEQLIEDIVKQLCDRDAPQLFARMEGQAREHVMNLRVRCLSLLLSPEQHDVHPGHDGRLSAQQAIAFLHTVVHEYKSFMRTVRNMQFMAHLETHHLAKFGVDWAVVNEHLFDSVVYQTPLIQSSIQRISTILAIDVQEENASTSFLDLEGNPRRPSTEAVAGAHQFRWLTASLHKCRSVYAEGARAMEAHADREVKLYYATLKAKRSMLKEDLTFFTNQRRMLEEYVSKGDSTSSAAELAVFDRSLRRILCRPRVDSRAQHVCPRCSATTCPCDECAISHLIGCGVVIGLDEGGEEQYDDYTDDALLAECDDDLAGVPGEERMCCSSSASDDYVDVSEQPTRIAPSLNCLAKQLVDGPPKSLYRLHSNLTTDGSNVPSSPSTPPSRCTRELCLCRPLSDTAVNYANAHGDWETPLDDTTAMFPALPLHLRRAPAHMFLLHERRGNNGGEECQGGYDDIDVLDGDWSEDDADIGSTDSPHDPDHIDKAVVQGEGGRFHDADWMTRERDEIAKVLKRLQSGKTGDSRGSMASLRDSLLSTAKKGSSMSVEVTKDGVVYEWDEQYNEWTSKGKEEKAANDDRLKLLNEMADRLKASGRAKKAGKSAEGEEEEQHCNNNCADDGNECDKTSCNCWHCAMFGDGPPPSGLLFDDKQCNTYAANAERLRIKLDRRKKEAGRPDRSASIEVDRGVPTTTMGARGGDIDELLEFIEGATAKSSSKPAKQSKAAKRLRQRKKKADERVRAEESKCELEEGESADAILLPTDGRRIDEILDDDERHVEMFKRFVTSCRPRANRPKVHMDMASLLSDNHA